MATIVLQTVGAVAGEFIGGPVGALIGRAIGAAAGAVIDQRLFGQHGGGNRVGPRLSSLAGLASIEGAVVPRVFGRVRVGGQMIWATRFEEAATTERAGAAGGKGGGAGAKSTTFSYFANFAVGLCEGSIAEVRRVWADGKEIDVSKFTLRVHRGDENQTADPLIVAKEGAENAPAYRGTAYVVFERMPLADFGNRVPQLAFEVIRPIEGLGSLIRAVDLIPGATEYAYATNALMGQLAPSVSQSENRHQLYAASDMIASLDALQALCPNLESVALVVAWFGDDLRVGHCTVTPRVERRDKQVQGQAWQVAGYTRVSAPPVSQIGGAPAYGGSPPDNVVISAIQELKARGLKVVLYPFIMMDIAPDNMHPDPWTGAASQPAFPWRGRITCDPAPGQPGSPDATAGAAAQIANFFAAGVNAATPTTFRDFILHYAGISASAGGVDAFLIGSEFAGLTRVRSASGVYPAADSLAVLAGDVKTMLGAATKVSYAADWTEFGAHVLADGAEVRFPLDVVWGSSSVDFVGVDAYFPLSDWRDGASHLDTSIARSVYDLDYLRARVASGEAYDWYYADEAARNAQIRSPITDGAYGKPWVFRQKDLAGWWGNLHYERIGGVELTTPTTWAPRSKPIWLTEIGCPAVDRGANQPNVFPDPKSSESRAPWFSRGFRDDLMQARALEAMLTHFDASAVGYVPGANPVSPVYGGPMVDLARIHIWAWDARPFPAFPTQSRLWTDAPNWETGHWLNGRLEGLPLDRLVKTIVDISRPDVMTITRPLIDGFVDGYALDRIISARAAIEPLAAMFGFDGILSGGSIRFSGRASRAAISINTDDLIETNGKLMHLTRAQESEIPREIALTFSESLADYKPATVLSRRIEGGSRRQSQAELAVVIERDEAQRLADIWLQDLWIARENAEFSLRPSLAALEVGDSVSVDVAGNTRLFRIQNITDAHDRKISARAIEPSIYDAAPPILPRDPAQSPSLPGPPLVKVLDLAMARDEPATLQHIAVFADPWPGPVALWRATGSASFNLVRTIDRAAIIGATLDALAPGPAGRLDRANSVKVSISRGALSSVEDPQMFAGANVAALRGTDGAWEIFSFADAELLSAGVYRLSHLVRGLGGEEHLAKRILAAGADFVLLDRAVSPLTADLADIGAPVRWRVGPASLDHADPAYVEIVATATFKALTPYSPVRPSARRSVGGVSISFLRRGRSNSDAWQPIDTQLGEDREVYEIEILNGASVVRTIRATSNAAIYSSVDELTDFGAPLNILDLRIYQMSAAAGRGFPLAASVAIA